MYYFPLKLELKVSNEMKSCVSIISPMYNIVLLLEVTGIYVVQ